jgi:hypothetical protein
MTSLRQLQEQFQTYVHQQKAGIEGKIIDAPQISVHERVEIYREGYYLRLIDILEREFSALKNLLGKTEFDQLCHEYIDTYPSTHFSVRTYGRYMVTFLSRRANSDPLHVELADFEWAFGKVIDAPDGPQLSVDDMVKIPPEAWMDLRLEFHPSMRMVPLRFNTPAIWQALFNNNPELFPVPAQESAEQPLDWLVWRFNQQAHYHPVTPEQSVMIRAIQENKSFPEICEALCDCMEVDQVAQFAGSTLREWVSLGLISRHSAE